MSSASLCARMDNQHKNGHRKKKPEGTQLFVKHVSIFTVLPDEITSSVPSQAHFFRQFQPRVGNSIPFPFSFLKSDCFLTVIPQQKIHTSFFLYNLAFYHCT